MKVRLVFKKPVDELIVSIDGNTMDVEVPSIFGNVPYRPGVDELVSRVVRHEPGVAYVTHSEQLVEVTEVQPKRRGRPRKSSDLHRFEEWYKEYPRKVGRGNAEKAWRNLGPSDELVDTMVRALRAQHYQPDWMKDNGAFIPHPATWLNGKRWLDELPKEAGAIGDTLPYAGKPWGAFIKDGTVVEVLNLMVQVGLDDASAVLERAEGGESIESLCDWLWSFKEAGRA